MQQPIFDSLRSPGTRVCLVLSAAFLRGNSVIHRTQKVIQGDDNSHVGRPCQVSPDLPFPELL